MNRKEKIIKLYDSRASEYEDWFDRHDDVFQKELALLHEHHVSSKKSLEVGVGSGRFASALSISKGIAPSLEMIKLCKDKGIDAALGFAENLPFEFSEFEQVFFITSLCFVEDVDKAIAEASRVLKNDGVITIAFIDKNSAMGIMYQENRGEYFEDAVFLTAEELLAKMEKFDFKHFKMSGINFSTAINKPPFDFCVMSFRKLAPLELAFPS